MNSFFPEKLKDREANKFDELFCDIVVFCYDSSML